MPKKLQTDSISSLYSGLAKVPALSCRIGYVPYDRAFGALTGGCVSFDRTFEALIKRFLSMQKSLTKKKKVCSSEI